MAGKNFAERTVINDNYSKKLIRGTVHATVGIDSPNAAVKMYGKNINRIELLRLLEKESKFKLVWYLFFLSFALVFTIIFPESYLSNIELVLLMVCIDLASKGKILGLYLSIFEYFLYSYIAFSSGLMGEVIKNLAIGLPLNIYTIISWTKNKKQLQSPDNKYKNEDADIVIKKMKPKHLVLSLFMLVVAAAASYCLLRFGLKQNVTLVLSSFTLGAMLVYKVLNAIRYMESWIFGIVQSGLGLIMWCVTIFSGSMDVMQIPMIAVTLAVVTNNIYGYAMWKALYRRVAINGGTILNRRKVSIKRIIKLKRRFKKLTWDKKIDIAKNS